MLASASTCLRCGCGLSEARLQGLCPACLLQAGLLSEHAVEPGRAKLPSIDGYHLIEQIGVGGMGVVYKARQLHPIERLVAIKLIKLGMDTQELIARFEAERQALAQLNHPNVAAVYHADATAAGRPFFVMEYVPGEAITAFCDRHRYTTRQRLELFVQACAGIQHAHQKAIIHRDIKPSNLLVMLDGGKPLVKVIDFGIAKATAQRLTEQTMFTAHGQLIGTPEYMSPEQAQINATDIDTRTDVYSLGVVLYELLSGMLPFEPKLLRTAAFGEIQRIIREVDPPRPSTRICLTEGAGGIAAMHQTHVAALARELRSELEWIPLKAMRKHRGNRYAAVSELASDVQNYLAGKPLFAGPESRFYRVRKFARRNKGPVVVAAVIALLVVAAVSVSSWQAVRLKAEQQRTLAQKREADRKSEQAQKSERVAQERLYAGLIASGDSYLASKQAANARNSFSAAWDMADRLHLSPLSATTGLLESYEIAAPPLMGSEREGGIKGFEGSKGSFSSIVISPDGRSMITTSFYERMRSWDLRTGRLMRVFGDADALNSGSREAAFSPDGRTLVEACKDFTAVIWDLQTGKSVRVFPSQSSDLQCAAFAPDGRTVATGGGGSEGTVVLWDVATGKPLHTLKPGQNTVYGAAFTPDGRLLVTVGENPDLISVWDVATGKRLRILGDGKDANYGIALSPDGRFAVTGSHRGIVKIWNFNTGELLYSTTAHRGPVHKVKISSDGRIALSAGTDGALRLWELEGGKELRSFQQQERMLGAAFSPDGSKIVGVGSGGRIMMFSAVQSGNAAGFPTEAGHVLNISLSKDGRVALSCALEDPSIALWDVSTKKLLRRMRSDSVVWSVSLSPVRPLAASSHADGTVRLWDLNGGTLIRTLAGHTDIATTVVFAPDGRTLLSSSSDKTVKLWDVDSGELLRTLSRHGGKVRGVAFSPDGSIAASASFDNHIILWEVATGKPLRTLSGHGHWVHCVSFSPDGRRLVSAGWDSRWAIWDVETGKMLRKVPGHTHVVVAATFSIDGRQVLTGSFDGSMRLWDGERGEELRSFSREEGAVRSVVSLPDGSGALWASDSTMRRWDWDQAKRYRDFERRLPAAQAAVTANPDDPAALATYGEWYAFRGVHDWAAEFLENSRSKGGEVSSLELARSYWQSGNLPAAEREFRRARERGEASAEYLDLCLHAVTSPEPKH